MSNYLSKLNGWQRVFIFVVIFLYIPVAGIVMAEVETIYERKYSDQELNILISEWPRYQNNLRRPVS
jgi:membrane-anchored glycerophosphoryl diester phosphodiesterase (GDPDase)